MPTIPERFIRPLILAGIALIAVLAFMVPRCTTRHAQDRVDAGQHGAALDSGKDALNVQQGAAARETASEALSRDNEKDIRSADGASDRVKAPVDAAGRKALCRRAAYADDPKCAIFRKAN